MGTEEKDEKRVQRLTQLFRISVSRTLRAMQCNSSKQKKKIMYERMIFMMSRANVFSAILRIYCNFCLKKKM
jgi:hypothetical protein